MNVSCQIISEVQNSLFFVIKTSVVSCFVYIGKTWAVMLRLKQILSIWLHLYREYIFKVKRLLFNFKWNTFDRIKRNTLIGDITDICLSIIEIESKFKTLKAAWIPQIVFSKGTLFEIFESFFLEKANLYLNYVLQFFETNLNVLNRISNPLSSVNKSVTSRTYKLMIFLNNPFWIKTLSK